MDKLIKTGILILLILFSVNLINAQNTDNSTTYSASVPARVESVSTLQKFFSNSPKFKCSQTHETLVLTYNSDGYVAYVGDKLYGNFTVELIKGEQTKALIGLPYVFGYAPILLTLNGNNTTLSLLPVQGEENLSYNSRGRLQYGKTGNKTWMELTLCGGEIGFTPVDYKPSPQIFNFIGFSTKKYLTASERKAIKLEEDRKKEEEKRKREEERRKKEESLIAQNPLLTHIKNSTFIEGLKLANNTDHIPSSNYIVEVKANKHFAKCYEDFWNEIMKYVDPSTMKIKKEYYIGHHHLVSAFYSLYIKTLNQLLKKIDFRKGEGTYRNGRIFSYVPIIESDWGKGTTYSHNSVKISKYYIMRKQNFRYDPQEHSIFERDEYSEYDKIKTNFKISNIISSLSPIFIKFFKANNINWEDDEVLSQLAFLMTGDKITLYKLEFSNLPNSNLYLWINGKKVMGKKWWKELLFD